jgi:hypothetical protein
MERNASLSRRHHPVAGLITISFICGVACLPIPLMAQGGESAAAPVIELSDTIAKELAALGCAGPIVALTREGWGIGIAPGQKLILPDVQGPGCVPEGAVSCCDEASGTWAINIKEGWLSVRQRCEEPPHDEGVQVVKVPQSLTSQLHDLGFIDQQIDCADSKGEGLVLWNWPYVTPSTTGGLLLPPRMMQGSVASHISPISHVVAAETRAPIVLAHGHSSSSCDGNEPDSCKQKKNKVCHEDEEHWWRKMAIGDGETWCRREPCSCP